MARNYDERARSRRSGQRRGSPASPGRPSIRLPAIASPGAESTGSPASISPSARRSPCPSSAGLGDRDISVAVRAAHDSSVDAALGYLEGEACWSRRGTNGFVKMPGDGFVAAAFRHRTSRAGDPISTRMSSSRTRREARTAVGERSTRGTSTCTPRPPDTSTRHSSGPSSPVASASPGHRSSTASPTSTASPPGARTLLDSTPRDRGRDGRAGVSSARAAQFAVLETRQAKDYDVQPSLLAHSVDRTGERDRMDVDELDAVLGRSAALPWPEEAPG